MRKWKLLIQFWLRILFLYLLILFWQFVRFFVNSYVFSESRYLFHLIKYFSKCWSMIFLILNLWFLLFCCFQMVWIDVNGLVLDKKNMWNIQWICAWGGNWNLALFFLRISSMTNGLSLIGSNFLFFLGVLKFLLWKYILFFFLNWNSFVGCILVVFFIITCCIRIFAFLIINYLFIE